MYFCKTKLKKKKFKRDNCCEIEKLLVGKCSKKFA